jgi:hypothetical protein
MIGIEGKTVMDGPLEWISSFPLWVSVLSIACGFILVVMAIRAWVVYFRQK